MESGEMRPSKRVAVIMQRRAVQNRWQSEVWEALGVLADYDTPGEARVFVMWRMEQERAVPQFVTVSYDEASRWMDGGEQVDSVAMPAGLFAWVGEFVEKNYRPEPKKRIKPQSFLSPKDRARS
jgi:hypothetical protein